jgi:hypothetical protein
VKDQLNGIALAHLIRPVLRLPRLLFDLPRDLNRRARNVLNVLRRHLSRGEDRRRKRSRDGRSGRNKLIRVHGSPSFDFDEAASIRRA